MAFIDWMMSVTRTFKLEEKTYFKAVQVFDQYNALSKENQEEELHLNCIVSLFLASKFQDKVPLLLETVKEKLGENLYSTRQILQKEQQILRVLNFDLSKSTIHDLLEIELHENDLCKMAKVLARFLSGLVQHDQELSQCDDIRTAAAVLSVTLSLVKKQKGRQSEIETHVGFLLPVQEEETQKIAKRLLSISKTFFTAHPQLTELKKAYFAELSSL